MRADSALARGDEIHRRSKEASDSGEDGYGSRLPETKSEDPFWKTNILMPVCLSAFYIVIMSHGLGAGAAG